MRHLIALAALLIFLQPAHAQSLVPVDPALLSAAMIGVTIGFLIAALGYMVAHIIGTPQVLGWAKNEVFENLYTLVLVSSVLVFSVAGNVFFISGSGDVPDAGEAMLTAAVRGVDRVLSGDPDATFNPQASEQRADKLLKELEEKQVVSTKELGIQQIFIRTYAFEIAVGELAYIAQMKFQPMLSVAHLAGGGSVSAVGTPSATAPLLPGLTKVADVVEQVNELVFIAILIMTAHKGVLLFIMAVGPIIFIAGIFFRALPFTRRLGSTIIALFITLYFVYPAFMAFTLSDGFYGRIVKDFSGQYMNVNWLSGVGGDTSSKFIMLVEPAGISTVDEDGLLNISFTSSLPVYNYTVWNEDESKIATDAVSKTQCRGEAVFSDTVRCTVKAKKPGNALDLDSLEGAVEFYSINISFMGPGQSDDFRELDMGKYYKYEYGLSFPILPVKACESAECRQSLLKISETFIQLREAYIAEQKFSDSHMTAEMAGDVLSLAGKGLVHHYGGKFLGGVSKSALKTGVKTGGKLLPKIVSRVAGVPGLVLSLVTSPMIKSDISTFLFDEIVCDAYSGTMADAQFGEPINDMPEVTAGKGLVGYVDESLEVGGEVMKDIAREGFMMYSESDYKTCANSIGLFNWLFGKVATWASDDMVNEPREFNVTVLMTRVVIAFMISFFAVVVSVTLFRSISENIGGDSSLMGLGKLL